MIIYGAKPFLLQSGFSANFKVAMPTYAGELSDHPRINHQKVKQQTASTAQFLTCIYYFQAGRYSNSTVLDSGTVFIPES
jgi:hypothetical protein